MSKLIGRLQYLGWFNFPWNLMMDSVAMDLWPLVDKFLISLNGKYAKHDQERDSYTLAADYGSKSQFKYVRGECIILEKPDNSGMSNVHAYLDDTLVWLSGRMVEIEIEYGKQIKFMADKTEKVYGVYLVGDGNSCEVPKGVEQTICKIGQPDCCIFPSAGTNGFQCEKFNGPTARMLLNRLAKDNIRANRIGNCTILGRKEEKTLNA